MIMLAFAPTTSCQALFLDFLPVQKDLTDFDDSGFFDDEIREIETENEKNDEFLVFGKKLGQHIGEQLVGMCDEFDDEFMNCDSNTKPSTFSWLYRLTFWLF